MAAMKSEEFTSGSSASRCRRRKGGPSPGQQAAGDSTRVDVPAVQAAREWQRTFDAVPDLIAILDTRRRIVRGNKAMADRLGLSKDQCVGQTCFACVHGTDKPPSLCPFSRLLEDGGSHTVEIHEERLAGDFLVTVSPLRDSTGRLIGSVHVARDITELRRAEEAACKAREELAERDRQEKDCVAAELEKAREELIRKSRLAAVGQVSASIAHDLRNPLGSVRNAAYYLKRILPKGDPRVVEFLGVIDEEIRAADRIIGSLLTMAQARKPAKQKVNLARLVTEAFNRSDRSGGVECRITTDPDPFELNADPGQLRQLIGNLLDNAIDAMAGQGQFIVEATRNAAYDAILIRDTGPGFARDVRRNLFEPLVSRKARGTGLGLAICRQIAESHGGTINTAEHEGPGAALELRLPR